MTTEPAIHTPRRPSAVDLSIILAACILIYWIGLGSTGLSLSEGLRAIPAWEMMETGEYFVTRMFGEAYFRKPPGMMWAIAASSGLFGPTEFAARAVSASACTVMALASWWFGRRWFGDAAGLVAGLSQALSPFLWEAGRSAEIEALHTLFVQLACLSILDHAVRRRWSVGVRLVCHGLVVIGIVGAVLTKGPAGLPVIAGSVLASLWLFRSAAVARLSGSQPSRAATLRVVMGLVVAGLVLGGALFLALSHHYRGLAAVTQSPGEFLWDRSKLGSIVLLPVVGLAAALPGSLAVLGVRSLWLSRRVEPSAAVVLAVMLAAVVSLLIFTVAGVSNPRYTMPVVPLWPVALGGVLTVALKIANHPRVRAAIGSAALLLVVVDVVVTQLSDRARAGDGGRGSGRPVGEAVARVIVETRPNTAVELWADGAVEARPEVLHYARRAAAVQGLDLRPRWSSALLRPFDPPSGAFVLVRVEGGVTEGGDAVGLGRAVVWEGRVAKFDLRLLGPRAEAANSLGQ